MKALLPHLLPFLGLLVLLTLTACGAYLPLGSGNLILALSIAFTKTFLVLLFFMELRKEDTLIRLAACVGLLWLTILLMLALADSFSRFPGRLLG
jgi:cytochrome c oxidase subunit 4